MKSMKGMNYFIIFLLLAGCSTPKEEEPNLDEMVLSEDDEILEGTLAGEVFQTPQEGPLLEELQSGLEIE